MIVERMQILKTGSIGFTTKVSGCWNCIHEIYESIINRTHTELPCADGIAMLGSYSSRSYRDGTNMYFVYDYNTVGCEPEEEIDKYHNPLNRIICEETTRPGGPVVHHHSIGRHRVHWSKLEHGSVWVLLEELEKQFNLNGIMNTGTTYPIEK